jgi:MoxR-like ATPase
MTTQINEREQFTLRVKRNSELDKMMRASVGGEPITVEELVEVGGKARSPFLLKLCNDLFDNVRVVNKRGTKDIKMSYVDLTPVTPVAVGVDVVNYAPEVIGAQTIAPEISDVKWPQAPPMVDSLGDVFRKPAWFDMMAAMVDNGRHIALAGSPGVGKDTAVQELAAQEGKILVTVSGDAGFRRKDLVGTLQIANGRSFFEVAEYAAAVVNGWWALVTEVNAADADALLFMNSQMAAPYVINIAGKAYPVHPDFRLFVSYNPGLVGTKPLPQSFKDRFFSIQVPFFTETQMKNILVAHGAPADMSWVDEIVKFGMLLWKSNERGQIRYQITSRRLMDAVALMKTDIVSSTTEAINLAVISAIDSPVEAQTARQILNNL